MQHCINSFGPFPPACNLKAHSVCLIRFACITLRITSACQFLGQASFVFLPYSRLFGFKFASVVCVSVDEHENKNVVHVIEREREHRIPRRRTSKVGTLHYLNFKHPFRSLGGKDTDRMMYIRCRGKMALAPRHSPRLIQYDKGSSGIMEQNCTRATKIISFDLQLISALKNYSPHTYLKN